MFDSATLRRMKPTAILVNTARGPIEEDAAFYQALTEVTPHAAYYSEETITTVRRIAAEEAVRVLTGLPARSPVNDVTAGSRL